MTWRLLCDQNIRIDTVDYLREQGLDVVSTRDLGFEETSEDLILAHAIADNRIVLTFNADFGDIRQFPPETHCGVIRLRIHPQDRETVHAALDRALALLTPAKMDKHIAVVEVTRIRLRGMS